MVQSGKRRERAIASHSGKLWVSSWHAWSQLCTSGACTGTLLVFPFPVLHTTPSHSVPTCTRLCALQGRDLVFGLTSSNLHHHKSRFFAFLYFGFIWVSHPYLQCSIESFWLSGPALEPFLWTNVVFAIFASLGTSFDLNDRIRATWGHPAISYLNSLFGKFNAVLESCNVSFYLFTKTYCPLCCGHQCTKLI